jgi:hypothetical protein
MKNLDAIVNEIKETVSPLMDRWVEDRVNVIMELKNIYRGLDENEEFNNWYNERRSHDRYFSRSSAKFYWIADMGYGKGDYMLAAYESKAEIQKKMEKQAEAKLKKIDVAVAKKVNFAVESVEKLFFREGKDGYFEGAWKLNDEKTFSFDTFYAGGYNIQCFHVRTKYKLK